MIAHGRDPCCILLGVAFVISIDAMHSPTLVSSSSHPYLRNQCTQQMQVDCSLYVFGTRVKHVMCLEYISLAKMACYFGLSGTTLPGKNRTLFCLLVVPTPSVFSCRIAMIAYNFDWDLLDGAEAMTFIGFLESTSGVATRWRNASSPALIAHRRLVPRPHLWPPKRIRVGPRAGSRASSAAGCGGGCRASAEQAPGPSH